MSNDNPLIIPTFEGCTIKLFEFIEFKPMSAKELIDLGCRFIEAGHEALLLDKYSKPREDR